MEYAAVSGTGVYYAVGNSNSTLWSYASGKWTKLISDNNGGQGIQAVAINPANPKEILAVAPSGYLNISYDAGATWTGNMWSSNKVEAADIPWLAGANTAPAGNTYLSVGGVSFNPSNTSQVVLSAGTGVWSTTQVPTSSATEPTPVTWSDMSTGIENVVANEIIVPPGGDPVLASWDRPFFHISNPDSYPTTYGPTSSAAIVAGWSVDYASSNPSFLVGIADWWGHEESGYSTDGGQTWTNFSTEIPGAGSSFIGGTIAASSQQNIVWAPANGNQPYYTLNGGETWIPVTLPDVSNWSNFDWAYYLNQRSVTADRVLSNTFYLYYPNVGVFSTANGGQSWSKVHSGSIGPPQYEGYNSTLMSVPGEKNSLFYTGGWQSGATPTAPVNEPFYRSTNGGATWTAVSNVLDVFTFGFGAPAPGQDYQTIYIVGYVNETYGIWQSDDDAQSWTNIGTYPTGELDQITTIAGDPNHYGEVYVGFGGGGYAYLPAAAGSTPTPTSTADTTPPSLSAAASLSGVTNRTSVTISGQVSDLMDAVTGVEVFDTVNGHRTDLGSATISSSGAWTFNATALANGVHQFSATATDAAGNTTALVSAGVPLTVDTTPPSLSAAASLSGVTNRTSVNISGQVSDLMDAVTGVEVFDTVNGHRTDLGSATISSSGAWTFNATALANGVHQFSATATDAAGNTTALVSAGVPLTVDTTPPSLSAAASLSGVTNRTSVNISGQVSDLMDAVTGVEVFDTVNGHRTDLGSATISSSGAWTFNATALANGVHQFSATATDAAGNTTALVSAGVPLTVDTVVPQPFITVITGNKDGGATLSGTSKANSIVTATDTVAGKTTTLGTVMTSTNGTWKITSHALLDRSRTNDFSVSAHDTAGNSGAMPGVFFLTSTGSDIFTSGPGVSNVFGIMSSKGSDEIVEFKAFSSFGAVHDYIDFSGRGVTSFTQIQSAMSGTTSTVIAVGTGNTINLTNITPTSLTASDFRFS